MGAKRTQELKVPTCYRISPFIKEELEARSEATKVSQAKIIEDILGDHFRANPRNSEAQPAISA